MSNLESVPAAHHRFHRAVDPVIHDVCAEEEPTMASGFPRDSWEPEVLQFVFVDEFYRSGGQVSVGPPPDDDGTQEEVTELLRMQTEERPAALFEILQQQTAAAALEYCNARWALNSPKARPRTVDVFWAAFRVPGPMLFRLKYEFNRARPHLVGAPRGLTAAIPVPGHPAYPSGHSSQFHLAAFLLGDIIPGAKRDLLAYANRVAVNRERAGLHYPSDTRAGIEVARQIYEVQTRKCPEFMKLFQQAQGEW